MPAGDAGVGDRGGAADGQQQVLGAGARASAPVQADHRPEPLMGVARPVLAAYQPDNPPSRVCSFAPQRPQA